jgi:hypothetical protein
MAIYEGNDVQFTFSSEILSDLSKQKSVYPLKMHLLQALFLLPSPSKLIRLTNKSPSGWTSVKVYESNNLASNDEKRLRQVENRGICAPREKRRNQTFHY